MKNRRMIPLAALMTAAALTLSACGTPAGTTPAPAQAQVSEAARQIADEYFAGDLNDFPAWMDVDRSKVICSVNDPDPLPEFNITFGDFIGEYMYYLIVYGITDDMSDENYDTCKSYRVNIINYLMFEKMYLYAAKNDYNITPETLTAEQLAEVRETADGVRSDWASNFYSAAYEKLGENASDEEISKLCDEVLDVIFEKCHIDYDMFYDWEINSKIQELTLAEMIKNVKVDEKDVDSELSTLVTHAEEAAKSDPDTYESIPSYQTVYVPDGTRTAKHILIALPEDVTEAIAAAATDAEADRLASEAFSFELQKKAEEASELLKEGKGIDELPDGFSGTGEHVVLKNSKALDGRYAEVLYGIDEAGGVSAPIVRRDGIYVIQYAGDAQTSESALEALKQQIRDYLKDQAETNIQVDAYNNWTTNYEYTVDCETLMIDESDVISNGFAEEGADMALVDID